jgi:ferritin-like metal-binding protein YciE
LVADKNFGGLQRKPPQKADISMKTNALKEVYVDELRDLYNCEQQLIKAIPKMAKAANSKELRGGFEEHLEQTKEHASRLERILQTLGEPVKGKKCKGMEGIVAEGGEVMSEDYEGAVMDAAIITAAQRVEHYEIAAYGSVHAFATLLGENEAANLLEKTLDEEKETDQKLTDLSQQINSQALDGVGSAEETDTDQVKPKQRAARAGSSR